MAKKKIQKKIREKSITVRLLHRRRDFLMSHLGKRFKRLAVMGKRAEKAKFGRLSLLRSVLTDEKMRILRGIKEHKPSSIYELAKNLKRDIKSVRGDVRQLAEIGFVKLEKLKIKDKKIQRTKPTLAVDRFKITIEFT